MRRADQQFLGHVSELALHAIRAQDATNSEVQAAHLDRAYKCANLLARRLGYKHPDDDEGDDDDDEEDA